MFTVAIGDGLDWTGNWHEDEAALRVRRPRPGSRGQVRLEPHPFRYSANTED